MIVNFQITPAGNFEIEQAMLCKQIEHVIQKRQTSIDPRPARAIQVQLDADIGFLGFALDAC